MKAFHNNFRDSSHNKQKLIFMLQFAVLNILVFVMNTLSPVFFLLLASKYICGGGR